MTQLSPAAQVVKDAVLALDPDRKTFKWVWSLCRPIAAAALRAAADQVVPEESEPSEQPFADLNDRWPTWYANKKTRRKLLDIADELENHQ
jgi:hypothetical protein